VDYTQNRWKFDNFKEGFTYDDLWNRKTRQIKETITRWKKASYEEVTLQQNYSTNNLNQYTELSTIQNKWKDENIDYSYDNNWNLKQDNSFKYFYDYKNRLVKTTTLDNEIVSEYVYDALWRRVLKETPEQKVQYIYAWQNATQEIITDKTTLETTTRDNVYSNNLDDILLIVVTNPDLTTKYQYYTKNHLWSTVAITDEKGRILEDYIYDVFWKAYIRDWKSTNHREFKKSPLWVTRLYTGREYDSETWLYYLRARYYNPTTGRFISRDPIGIRDDINLYAYVGNNTVLYVDLFWLSKNAIVWNLNSIRIIYEDSWVWHTHLQIWKNVYTYWAEWWFIESRLKWILSLVPNVVNANVSVRNIEEFLLFDKDLVIYDIAYDDAQKEFLNTFINDTISWEESYSLLGKNCASFVQAALVSSWIDRNFEEWFWLNIPYVYNWYLDELSKWDYNYINEVYNYSISEFSSDDVTSIVDTIENNYISNLDYLLNISPYVK